MVDGSRNATLSGVLDAMLAAPSIAIEPFTGRPAIACEAYRRFGEGSGHPGGLNLGDCFTYALAHDLGEPRLFMGDDFRLTDIELVSPPFT